MKMMILIKLSLQYTKTVKVYTITVNLIRIKEVDKNYEHNSCNS